MIDMASYYYPFQNILNLRGKETQLAQIQMAQAIQREGTITEELLETRKNIAQVKNAMQVKQSKGVSVQELRIFEEHLMDLRQKSTIGQMKLEAAHTNVNRKQGTLVNKLTEEKKWEFLKEKKALEFNQQVKSDEQKQTDELAGQRFHRSRAKG